MSDFSRDRLQWTLYTFRHLAHPQLHMALNATQTNNTGPTIRAPAMES